MLENINGGNAASHGQAVVDGLYKISSFVDAADQQTYNIPEDGGPDRGDAIISAMDSYCKLYKDMLDVLDQLHHHLAKAGFEKPIHDALDHSQSSFQSFSNGLSKALPSRSDDIDDNVEDMNGEYAKATKIYNGKGNDISSRDDDDDDDDCDDDDDDADNDDADDDDGDDDDDDEDDNGEDDDNDGENGDEDGGDDDDDGEDDDDHDVDGDDDEGDDDDE